MLIIVISIVVILIVVITVLRLELGFQPTDNQGQVSDDLTSVTDFPDRAVIKHKLQPTGISGTQIEAVTGINKVGVTRTHQPRHLQLTV